MLLFAVIAVYKLIIEHEQGDHYRQQDHLSKNAQERTIQASPETKLNQNQAQSPQLSAPSLLQTSFLLSRQYLSCELGEKNLEV